MQAFSGIDGQEKAVSYLSRALEEGQLTHAYLLAGATAATRRALARRFAAADACVPSRGGDGGYAACAGAAFRGCGIGGGGW